MSLSGGPSRVRRLGGARRAPPRSSPRARPPAGWGLSARVKRPPGAPGGSAAPRPPGRPRAGTRPLRPARRGSARASPVPGAERRRVSRGRLGKQDSWGGPRFAPATGYRLHAQITRARADSRGPTTAAVPGRRALFQRATGTLTPRAGAPLLDWATAMAVLAAKAPAGTTACAPLGPAAPAALRAAAPAMSAPGVQLTGARRSSRLSP